MSAKDKIHNAIDDVSAKAKEAAAKVMGDEDLKQEAEKDQAQSAAREAKEKVGEAAQNAKEAGKGAAEAARKMTSN